MYLRDIIAFHFIIEVFKCDKCWANTHIQVVNLIENEVDKKYDAFLWEFSHGGLFLASEYSENFDGFRRKFRYLGFVIILEIYLLMIGITVRKGL